MKKVIVVPDGIVKNDDGELITSVIYKAVLDEILRNYSNCQILLAPANNFGFYMKEQFVAYNYLKSNNSEIKVIVFDVATNKYINTWGNARFLRDYLISYWGSVEFETHVFTLVVGRVHANRAELCFRRNGFKIERCCPIDYSINKTENLPLRLFYYKFKFLHILYECFASLIIFIKTKE